jgi:type II secretory pathway component PulJ
VTKDLPELLVSLALGALVIAGALQMHTAFVRQGERQKQLSERQEALRLSMRLVASAVRAAGSVAPPVADDQGQCPGGPRRTPALDWSNGRLRVLVLRGGAPLVGAGENGGDLRVVRGDAAALTDGDLFQVAAPSGTCTREVSPPASGVERRAAAIPHEPVASCFNPAPADDRCLSQCTSSQPCPVSRPLGTIEFRVEGGRLVTRRARLGAASGGWTPVAADIDALEVSFVCDGDAPCDGARARAVRLTLTAPGRSLSELVALRNVS